MQAISSLFGFCIGGTSAFWNESNMEILYLVYIFHKIGNLTQRSNPEGDGGCPPSFPGLAAPQPIPPTPGCAPLADFPSHDLTEMTKYLTLPKVVLPNFEHL